MTVWPCAAAEEKIVFSELTVDGLASASHSPQLLEITFAVSSVTILR